MAEKRVPRELQSWAPSAKLIWWVIDEEESIEFGEVKRKTRLSHDTVAHHTSSLENTGLVESDGEKVYKIKNE